MSLIKELREKTSAGIMDCKKALEEVGGDLSKATEILRQRGLAKAEEQVKQVASQGLVEAYIHPGGRFGALVEVNCETDFVSNTDEFKALVHLLALQVVAMAPKYISANEIPADILLDPKVVCLLAQPYVKDESRTIGDIIAEVVLKTGEKVSVRRFTRYELGK